MAAAAAAHARSCLGRQRSLFTPTRLWHAPSNRQTAAHSWRARSLWLPQSLRLAARAQAGRPGQPPALPAAWEQRRQEVAAFVEQHGRVPRVSGTTALPLTEGERTLGLWCADQQQRRDGSKGRPLSRAERVALEAIPRWTWAAKRPKRVPWEQWCLEVAAFAAQHGCLPRQMGGEQTPLLPGERQLGTWRNRQVQRWKGKKLPRLTAAEQAALEAIPGWEWGKDFEMVPWEERLQQLAAFVAEHGLQPRATGGTRQAPLLDGEQQLGRWCVLQRQRQKGAGSYVPLSPEQQVVLGDIPGWEWEQNEMVPWEERLQQVAAFAAQHGRLPRVQGSQQEPLLAGEGQLGPWCHTQRQRQKGQGTCAALSLEQQAALEALPGWAWEQRESAPWEERLQHVAAFAAQHGRLPRTKGSKSMPCLEGEGQLGVWCVRQRRRRRGAQQPPLLPEQQAALESIPGWRWQFD